MRGEQLAAVVLAALLGGCELSDTCVRHSDCAAEQVCSAASICEPTPPDAGVVADAEPAPIDAEPAPIDAFVPDAPPVDANPADRCARTADTLAIAGWPHGQLRWRAPCSVLVP
jgi:hypothetical protein